MTRLSKIRTPPHTFWWGYKWAPLGSKGSRMSTPGSQMDTPWGYQMTRNWHALTRTKSPCFTRKSRTQVSGYVLGSLAFSVAWTFYRSGAFRETRETELINSTRVSKYMKSIDDIGTDCDHCPVIYGTPGLYQAQANLLIYFCRLRLWSVVLLSLLCINHTLNRIIITLAILAHLPTPSHVFPDVVGLH